MNNKNVFRLTFHFIRSSLKILSRLSYWIPWLPMATCLHSIQVLFLINIPYFLVLHHMHLNQNHWTRYCTATMWSNYSLIQHRFNNFNNFICFILPQYNQYCGKLTFLSSLLANLWIISAQHLVKLPKWFILLGKCWQIDQHDLQHSKNVHIMCQHSFQM